MLRLFAMWVRKGIALITRGDKLPPFLILLFDRSKLSLRRCERSSSCEQHVIINLYYCDLSWSANFYRCGLGSLLSLLSSTLEDEESTRLLCELCGSRKGKKREGNFGYRVVKERIPRVYTFMTKEHFLVSVVLMVEAVFSYHRSPCVLAFTCGSIVDQWRT